jgi:rhodanese-related sulfurtransferase
MTHISVEELKARQLAGEKINLIDVRENEERADFNIGGIHLRLGQIQTMQLEPIEHLREEEVIIYCRSGNRSQIAAMFLEMAGFTRGVNLTGGMLDWTARFGR